MEQCLTFDDVQLVPMYSEVRSRGDVDTSSKLDDETVLRMPLIASPMDTICEEEMAIALGNIGGLGIIHRFFTIEEQVAQIKSTLEQTKYVGAAIGATHKDQERIDALVEAGCRILDIDLAHGHCQIMQESIAWIKDKYPHVHIMAGAVATADAVNDLAQWGAHSIRVGVGNGSMCATRIQTGVGIPLFSALQSCSKAARNHGVKIIADGGCRTPGDVAKAFAAGADAIIIGSLFAGTKETPGSIKKTGLFPDQKLFKQYRGSASIDSKIARGEEGKNVEGTSTLVPYRGKVKRLVSEIEDGVRSAMSYVGAFSMADFQEKSTFVNVTSAGIREAFPHGLLKS